MPVTHEQLTDLRAQLQRDRETCGNSPLAQKFLDSAEAKLNEVEESWARRNPLKALDEVLSGAEIGADSANSEELKFMAADLSRWQDDFDVIPPSEHSTASYKFAEVCLQLLKQNYLALYLKHEVEILPAPKSATAN